MRGTPILEIRDLLGHASLAMTERYAHLIPDKKRESVFGLIEEFSNFKPQTDSEDSDNQS